MPTNNVKTLSQSYSDVVSTNQLLLEQLTIIADEIDARAEFEAKEPLHDDIEAMIDIPLVTADALVRYSQLYAQLNCALVKMLDHKSVVIDGTSILKERELALFKLGIVSVINLSREPSLLLGIINE